MRMKRIQSEQQTFLYLGMYVKSIYNSSIAINLVNKKKHDIKTTNICKLKLSAPRWVPPSLSPTYVNPYSYRFYSLFDEHEIGVEIYSL